MNKLIGTIAFIFLIKILFAQQDALLSVNKLSLQEVIALAKKQSPDALQAKNAFRSSYWQYRSYKAGLLPNLSFSSILPNLNRTQSSLIQPDGSESFVYRNTMNTSANLSLNQNVSLTGGSISLISDLQRIDLFSEKQKSYMATPVSINFVQPLNGYNSFKWDKKIEPLKYEKEKKVFLTAMENVSIKAINYFFSLASAQLNYEIAKVNNNTADTLYKIGKGRFTIGTIAEDELLQLELSLINSNIEVKRSELSIMQTKFQLINFLGLAKNSNISLIIPDTVPNILLNYNDVLFLANKNNPEVKSQEIQKIESDKSFAYQKSQRGFQASMMMALNLNKSADNIQTVYRNPQSGQLVQLGFSIPLIDWGQQKGKYKMAVSNREVVKVNIEQAQLQFEQNVYNEVIQFNFQKEQYIVACKSDTIAQLRYFISKNRYLINKISILELNNALSQRDASKRSFLSSIQSFWTNYYNIRKLTLFDFIENKELNADYDIIIE